MTQKISPKQTRLSFAHERSEFRSSNTLYQTTSSLGPTFESERCPYNAAQLRDMGKTEAQRRKEAEGKDEPFGSFMIKRQRPHLQPRPPRALAFGPDRAAFNQALDEDDKRSRQSNQPRRAEAINRLVQGRTSLTAELAGVAHLEKLASAGHTKQVRKETYLAKRRVEHTTNRAIDHSNQVMRSQGER